MSEQPPETPPLGQPAAAAAAEQPDRHPVRLVVDDDLRRSRLTVFFRLLLALPHLIVVSLWGIVALLVGILNWFATLIAGRSPDSFHRMLSSYMRYWVRVSAYLHLLANPYPPFSGRPGGYPIELEIDGPERQHRLATAFRLILAIPAFILAGVLGQVLQIIGFLGWFVCLALGRMPEGMRNLGAYCLRYQAQAVAYLLILTQRYPSLASGPTP